MMRADVVIVGAGSAGANLAGQLARGGAKVVLIDRRRRGETGARWVNGVPAWCFAAAGIDEAAGEELFKAGGTFIMAPVGARRTVAHRGPDKLLHVDMRRLVGRLLDGAVEAGASFVQATVTGLERSRDRVRVTAGDLTVEAALAVDASGLGAVLRGHDARWPARIDAADICAAAEHQFVVRRPEALARFLARYGAEPGDDLAIPGVAGGFSTLTLFTRGDAEEVGLLTGSVPALGVDNGARLVDRFVASVDWLGERTFGGQGAIPIRRPLAALVGERLALVGDAACQVYATHGSGVGMGLIAGHLLAEAVLEARDPGSRAALARYEKDFRQGYGGLLASSDALRRFAQRSPPGLAAGAVDAGLVDEETFGAGLLQRPLRPSPRAMAQLARRGLRAPRLAARFAPAAVRARLAEVAGPAGWIDRLVGSASPERAPVVVNPLTEP